jgi:hypothetical protein
MRSETQLHNLAKIAVLVLACLVGKAAACRIQDADIGYCDNGIRDDEEYRYNNCYTAARNCLLSSADHSI